MKYAIISDLHANLEALEAVLADMQPHADAVICLGDIVGYNANPIECLELVQQMCQVVIAGNHDQAACDLRLYHDFSEYAREAMHWTREQLTPEWFDSPGNQSMVEWDVSAADVYTMVVQVHLHRRRWRACLAGDLTSPHPLVELDQLDDLAWLDG